MSESFASLHESLRCFGQMHLLEGWESLPSTQQAKFAAQLRGIDFSALQQLYQKRETASHSLNLNKITPIPVETVGSASFASEQTRGVGHEALHRGEVAALVVAGGQGSRLGFEKPKGMYPVGPISRASLFQIHAEKVLALSRRHKRPVPFLVMTSPATDDETRVFFEENRHFGLDPGEVHFFQQGTMPALEIATGRLLLEKPGELFLSPNGHGGTLTALAESGLLAKLKDRGIRQIFYFQVDNPLVSLCDPVFVGRHIETRSEVSSKVVFKERPEEKVGVLALVEGRKAIVEYSDLPIEMTKLRDANGELQLRAGNPAIHLFSVEFLDRLTSRTGTSGGLTFHIARKKVPHYDPTTKAIVTPATENALKFEMFIFDALPLAERWLVLQTLREEEFAPLKNAEGPDSPQTVHALMVNRAARWLEAAGAKVARTPERALPYPIEISPLYALDMAELEGKLPPGFEVTGPTYLTSSD